MELKSPSEVAYGNRDFSVGVGRFFKVFNFKGVVCPGVGCIRPVKTIHIKLYMSIQQILPGRLGNELKGGFALNQEKYVATVIRLVKGLNAPFQRVFLKALFDGVSEKKRVQWLEWTCHAMYPETRWIKLDRWMEGMFKGDINRSPSKVASMGINYFSMRSNMYPFLVKMAQRIKCRVLMRQRRHPEENEEGEW